MLTGETLSYNRFLYKQLPYDPDRDFAPITNLFFNTQAGGERRPQGEERR